MTMDDPVERTRLRLAEISVDGDQLVELRGLLINNIETSLRQLDFGNLTALELVVEAMIRSGTAWAAEAGLRHLLVETHPQDRGPVDSLLQRVIYEKETPSDEFLAALEELSGESLDREYRRRVVRQDIAWGGRTLTLETGKVARQADGAVMATLGETVVLCAVTVAKSVNDRQDFFPLTVHYQEKYSAAGRIPGGFFKRERGASEKETLISRLIDRPIRPLFPKAFRNEINVVAQVLSYDGENEPDILAMVAASAALAISGVPVKKHIGAARVGYLNGEYVLNPTDEQVAEGDLDLVVAATDSAVIMVESEANELSEEVMLGAVLFAHDACRVVTAGISEFQDRVGVEPWDRPAESKHAQAAFKLRERLGREVTSAYQLTDKSARTSALAVAREKAHVLFEDGSPGEKSSVGELFKALEAQIVRTAILKEGKRIDGRTTTQIRPIVAETGFLPRAHGSALFTRGETQTIATCTLGTKDAEQMVDGLNGLRYERFMLHYNFPPYSVGEVGRFGASSRRDVGHGKLAWCALHAVLPSKDDFPYTIRLSSDITESNGSSSMASVCGGSLAMMDAGVPIKRPVAGIAMGLILDGNHFAILSDIMGDEDHLGDMDFKVAGTSEGITTMQMDIKIAGITREIFEAALNQAKEGRAHILAEMAKAVYHTREELSAHAPRIETLSIDKSKIRDVIGTGGKVIREIVATTGAKVDIDDEGLIQVSSSDKAQIEAAINWIKGIVEEPEVGKIYNGKVVNIVDFGAFVNFMGGKDGLVHISEIKSERVDRISDVLSEGQKVMVKVLEVNPRGKVRLSMRVVDQETGEELEDTRPAREPRERDRGIRGDRGSRRDEDRGPRRDRGGRGPRRERAQDKEEDRVASEFTPAFLTTTVGDD